MYVFNNTDATLWGAGGSERLLRPRKEGLVREKCWCAGDVASKLWWDNLLGFGAKRNSDVFHVLTWDKGNMYPRYLVGKNSVFMISLAKREKKKQKYSCNENLHTNQVTVQLNSYDEYHSSSTLSTQRQGIPVQYASLLLQH